MRFPCAQTSSVSVSLSIQFCIGVDNQVRVFRVFWSQCFRGMCAGESFRHSPLYLVHYHRHWLYCLLKPAFKSDSPSISGRHDDTDLQRLNIIQRERRTAECVWGQAHQTLQASRGWGCWSLTGSCTVFWGLQRKMRFAYQLQQRRDWKAGRHTYPTNEPEIGAAMKKISYIDGECISSWC